MIRVFKSPNAPASLAKGSSYDDEDVIQQLQDDHHKKCYLCERTLCADFQVEHYKSKAANPDLEFVWSNLFWSCGYCNNKKSARFDNILNPTTINIEDEIKQTIDFSNKKAIFTTCSNSPEHDITIQFLQRIHNGTGISRKIREENFFEHIIGVVNSFMRLVCAYLTDICPEKEALVREELQIDKECLGFKYWIIKSNPALERTFAADIIWNKK